MSKMSIAWHEDCLRNKENTLKGRKIQLEIFQREVDREQREVYIYQGQIKRAKEERKDGFDSEKFNKKKGK